MCCVTSCTLAIFARRSRQVSGLCPSGLRQTFFRTCKLQRAPSLPSTALPCDRQELPQHACPKWLSSRSQDFKNCRKRSSTGGLLSEANIPHHLATQHDVDGSSINTFSISTPDVPEPPTGREEDDFLEHSASGNTDENSGVRHACCGSSCARGSRRGTEEREQQRSERDGSMRGTGHEQLRGNRVTRKPGYGGDADGCVTLGMTTCKRIKEFMGTVAGLKVCGLQAACGSTCTGTSMSRTFSIISR